MRCVGHFRASPAHPCLEAALSAHYHCFCFPHPFPCPLSSCTLSLSSKEPEFFALTPASFDDEGGKSALLALTRSTRVAPTGPNSAGAPAAAGSTAVVPSRANPRASLKDNGDVGPVTRGPERVQIGRDGSAVPPPRSKRGSVAPSPSRPRQLPPHSSLSGSGEGGEGGGAAAGLGLDALKAPVMLLDRHVVEASRGVPWQLFNQVRGVFIEMLRRHHVVLSIFMANGDAQLPLTLTQRILVSSVLLLLRCACSFQYARVLGVAADCTSALFLPRIPTPPSPGACVPRLHLPVCDRPAAGTALQ